MHCRGFIMTLNPDSHFKQQQQHSWYIYFFACSWTSLPLPLNTTAWLSPHQNWSTHTHIYFISRILLYKAASTSHPQREKFPGASLLLLSAGWRRWGHMAAEQQLHKMQVFLQKKKKRGEGHYTSSQSTCSPLITSNIKPFIQHVNAHCVHSIDPVASLKQPSSMSPRTSKVWGWSHQLEDLPASLLLPAEEWRVWVCVCVCERGGGGVSLCSRMEEARRLSPRLCLPSVWEPEPLLLPPASTGS